MNPRLLAALLLAGAATAAPAAVTTLTDPDLVRAFQQGLAVETFEAVPTRTPMVIASFTSGIEVAEAAKVYDQIGGVRLSAGGTVGVQRPALFQHDPDVGIDAVTDTVLGSTDNEGLSRFDRDSLIEMYFPARVRRLGFEVLAGLSPVRVYLLSTNFAFSGEDEQVLDQVDVPAGSFVAFERDRADIGGLKILSRGDLGWAIDDLSFDRAGSGSVPEPQAAALVLAALAVLGLRRRQAGAG